MYVTLMCCLLIEIADMTCVQRMVIVFVLTVLWRMEGAIRKNVSVTVIFICLTPTPVFALVRQLYHCHTGVMHRKRYILCCRIPVVVRFVFQK